MHTRPFHFPVLDKGKGRSNARWVVSPFSLCGLGASKLAFTSNMGFRYWLGSELKGRGLYLFIVDRKWLKFNVGCPWRLAC
jgi:hypothetical protein